MAEDQGVRGDSWNKQAVALLSKFGWDTIGDYDMDLPTSEGKEVGVDKIMKYETVLKNRPQPVILEAKCYLTTSFNKSNLQDWINRLDKKLLLLRNSSPFVEKFPIMNDCSTLDTGLICIWFRDVNEYKNFHATFQNILSQISTSNRIRKAGVSKLYVMDNYRILRLIALHKAIEDIKKGLSENDQFKFSYFQTYTDDKPISKNNVLTIEMMFSDFVLAEVGATGAISTACIFYFGKMDYDSLELLASFIKRTPYWEQNSKMVLYTYDNDEEFRKIKPDVKKFFNPIELDIKSMENPTDLPSFLKDIE